MSLGGRSDAIASLRRAIARLEGSADLAGGAGRQGPAERIAPGPLWLARALGGGLKSGVLYEITPDRPGDSTAAAGFALGLALQFLTERSGDLVWVSEDFASLEWGAPYGPGLRDWGLDPRRLVFVRAGDAAQTLWALEESAKCRGCGAVLGELRVSSRRAGEVESRRLALAAQASGAPCVLAYLGAFGGAVASHGAQARFAVRAATEAPREGRDLDLFGPPRLLVRLLKTRLEGGRTPPADPESLRALTWNPARRLFEDPAEAAPAVLPFRRIG